MSKQFSILDRIAELNPTIGPGNMLVCRECTEHLKHDVDHRIAEEVSKMVIPASNVNGKDEWAIVRDLIRIREAKYGE